VIDRPALKRFFLRDDAHRKALHAHGRALCLARGQGKKKIDDTLLVNRALKGRQGDFSKAAAGARYLPAKDRFKRAVPTGGPLRNYYAGDRSAEGRGRFPLPDLRRDGDPPLPIFYDEFAERRAHQPCSSQSGRQRKGKIFSILDNRSGPAP